MEHAYDRAHHRVIDERKVIVDRELQNRLVGWKPRRHGGGLGGRSRVSLGSEGDSALSRSLLGMIRKFWKLEGKNDKLIKYVYSFSQNMFAYKGSSCP